MMESQNLKTGDVGDRVLQWQQFLVNQSLLKNADGIFGDRTRDATIEFQRTHGLKLDGIVGEETLKIAISVGYVIKQNMIRPLLYIEKQSMYGPLICVASPSLGNPEGVKISNNWKGVKKIHIPQLMGMAGAPKSCDIIFHSKGIDNLVKLWKQWEIRGLLHLVLSWDGSWSPRFIRGSTNVLSSHAFGIAFDINAKWNPIGVSPPASGVIGSVVDLVPTANEFGFFWGGNFSRRDGMHFELGSI